MKIGIHYFAMLRELAKVDSEIVETDALSARALWDELSARRGFGLEAANFSVAVNDTFVDWDRALAEGDQVVFLPPVSGG